MPWRWELLGSFGILGDFGIVPTFFFHVFWGEDFLGMGVFLRFIPKVYVKVMTF